MAKILYIDIETAPKIAYVWNFFKTNISPKQVLDHGYIMSFSAIWNDDTEDKIIYSENRSDDDAGILSDLIDLLDEADVVIGQNVAKFDCKSINGRALVAGLQPPSPYKVVDTYLCAKNFFKFESNSLEYLTKILKVENAKTDHAKYPGWELWLQCLKQNDDAWNEMRKYNIQDTIAVRQVYLKMRPWITNHANIAVHQESESHSCPKCNSTSLTRRGFAFTNVGKYQRYKCNGCGGWCRTRFTELDRSVSKSLLTNVAQ